MERNTSNNIHKWHLDDEGNAINDIFLSLEGFGLDILIVGLNQDGANLWSASKDLVKNIKVLLADERPADTNYDQR